jgi:NCS2 family nucleobase:cation symporter-2
MPTEERDTTQETEGTLPGDGRSSKQVRPGNPLFSGAAWALAMQLTLPGIVMFVLPTLVLRATGASPEKIVGTLSLALLVLAISVVVQSRRKGPLGAGLLLPSTPSALYFGPSMIAAKAGGLPLVFGMTLIAAFAEGSLSFLLKRLQPVFTPSINGLIIFLVGIEIGLSGVHELFREVFARADPTLAPIAIAVVAIIVLTITAEVGGATARTMTPVLVFAAATGFDWFLFALPENLGSQPLFALPRWPDHGIAFRYDLLPAFLAAGIAATVRAASGIPILHAASGAPGLLRTAEGMRADGAGTALSAASGSIGLTVSLSSIPAEHFAANHDRRIAFNVAIIFAVLAFCPAVLVLISVAPGAAVCPLLVYFGVAMAIRGFQDIVKDRELPGFTWQVGLPLLFSMATISLVNWSDDGLPALAPIAKSLAGYGVTIGILSALLIRVIIVFASARSGTVRASKSTKND